jgi:hypothetical protein
MKRRIRTRAGVYGIPVILGCALVFAFTASAANSNKPYSVVICGNGQTGCTSSNPAVVAPGGSTSNPATLTVTFKNNNKLGSGIKLGSDNLNVPAAPSGISVIDTSLPACPASPSQQGPSCFLLLDGNGNVVSSGGTTIGFRNLNLAPGASITIRISAATPPPSTTACTTTTPCPWSDRAKQSNDFSGTGNDLKYDGTGTYAMVTSAVASCPKNQGCSTKLGNGGNASGSAGSVSVAVATSKGKTGVTQVQALDFGTPLDPNLCSGITSLHEAYWNLSNGADNGSDRSQTVSITTTFYDGYDPHVCFFTSKPFTQVVLTNGIPSALAPATATTVDGTVGYQGLLPDCGTKPLQPYQVDCTKNPGLQQRGVTNPDGTVTSVIAVPPGFDARAYN